MTLDFMSSEESDNGSDRDMINLLRNPFRGKYAHACGHGCV